MSFTPAGEKAGNKRIVITLLRELRTTLKWSLRKLCHLRFTFYALRFTHYAL